jgi:signal transduction histidine kinase
VRERPRQRADLRPGSVRVLGTALFLLLVAAASAAQENDRYRVLVDSSQSIANPQQALAALQQQPAPSMSKTRAPLYLSEGASAQPMWIETPIPAGTRRITIVSGWVERFEAHVVSGGQVVQSSVGGTREPAGKRAVADLRLVVRVPPDERPRSLLLRHESELSQAVYPLQFFTIAEYSRDAMLLHLRHGIFYGLMLLACAFTGVIWFATRDRSYLYMNGYITSITAVLASLDGSLATYLLPSSPNLSTALASILVGLTIGFSLLFGLRFLKLHHSHPELRAAARLIAVTATLFGVAMSFYPIRPLQLILLGLLALAIAINIWLAVTALRNKRSMAPYFVVARIPVVLGVSALALATAGWRATTLANDMLLAVVSFEILVLTFAMARGFAQEQQVREAAVAKSRRLGVRISRLQAITDEASELRKVQRDIQDAQRLRTVSQMASGIAHDFNNIFTSVMGFSELLRLEAVLDNPAQRDGFIRQINEAGHRGSDLVQQLLIYSRSTKPELTRSDLVEVIRSGAELAQHVLAPDQRIELSLSEEPHYAVVDQHQIQQVLVNLIRNASEAMTAAGAIEIALARDTQPPHTCASCVATFSGERLVLSVMDNGHGLKEPPQELFTPFYTSKEIGTGSGLGLSVVDGIVHEHGGHLLMGNRPGGGTRVDVFLPESGSMDERIDPQAPLLYLEQRGTPSPALAKLQRYYPVVEAQKPAEAQTLFLDSPNAFAALVIEVSEDQGEWIDLASQARSANPGIPILFLTLAPTGLGAAPPGGPGQDASLTVVLDQRRELDSLLTVVERLIHPPARNEHNIQSLRSALRRLQKQEH